MASVGRAAVVCGAWIATPLVWAYRGLAASMLRLCGYEQHEQLSAKLQQDEDEIEQRHQEYQSDLRSEATWLRFAVNLSSRNRRLLQQETYLGSYKGSLLIPAQPQRQALLERTQALRERFTRYHSESCIAVIEEWRQSFADELQRVRTSPVPANEARQTLQRLDASIDAARFVVGAHEKDSFHTYVQQVRRDLGLTPIL